MSRLTWVAAIILGQRCRHTHAVDPREKGEERMIADKDDGVTARAAGSVVGHGPEMSVRSGHIESLGLAASLDASCRWLLERQHGDGYWVGELEGDTILESEYVLLMAYLGRLDDPVCAKACRYIREQQLADGGWAIYPGGPSEVSASVKAYFALKLVGVPAEDPAMSRARAAVL